MLSTDKQIEQYLRYKAKSVLKEYAKAISQNPDVLIDFIVEMEKEASIFRADRLLNEVHKN